MRRLTKILLIVIPLLVIIAAAAAALWRQKLGSYLVPIVETQLSHALGREVRVGRISGGLVRGAVLEDLRIAEGEHLAQGAIVEVRRAAVRYNLRGLLFGGRNAVAAVYRIDVVGARLKLARDAAGRWNIAPLLKPRVPPVARFTGIVNIADSTIVYLDQRPPPSVRGPLRMTLSQVSARVTPHPERGGILRFAARLGSHGRERIAVAASSSGDRVVLDVALTGVSLAEWNPRLAVEGVRLSGGTADIEVSGSFGTGRSRSPFDYVARAEVHSAAVSVKQVREPLCSLNGSALITPHQVQVVRLDGAVAGARFTASGLISGLRQPQLNLRVKADFPAADTAARLARIRLSQKLRAGPGTVQLVVRGSLDHPVADGAMRIARAQVKRAVVSDVSAEIAYRGEVMWLHRLRFNAAGGQISADVWLRRQGGQVEAVFDGEGRELQFERLLAAADVGLPRPISCTAQAHFAGTYGAAGLRVGGSFKARDGRIGEVDFSSATGIIESYDGDLRIVSGRIESAAGSAAIEGTVTSQRALNLEVRASGVDLAAAARLLGAQGQQVAGTGYFAGTLSGTLSEPIACGTFQATDAKFDDQAFDLLSGKVAASRTAASAAELLAYQEGARYILSGSLHGLDRPREEMALDASVEVGYARLAQVLAMAGITGDVQGDVEASFKVGGTIGAPTASGTLRLHRPAWNGWPLDHAEAQFALSGDTVQLADAKAGVGESVVTASGQVSKEGDLQLEFSADVQLADLRPPQDLNFPFDLAGQVTASGVIKGTSKRPQITAQARCAELSVNGEVFANVSLETAYAEEMQGNAFRLTFAQGSGRFSVEGSTDLEGQAVQVAAALDNGGLARLCTAFPAIARRLTPDSTIGKAAKLVAGAPSPLGGRLDVQASLAGQWDDLKGEVKFETTDASVGGARVPDAGGTLGVAGRVIEVRRFEAREEPAYAAARGTVDLDGKLALEVDAYNLQAGLLEPLLGLKQKISGSADVSLSIAGTVQQPQVVGSMEVGNLGAGSLKVDHLQVPRFEVRGESLIAEQVIAAVGPNVVRASAKIPVTWKPLGIDRAAPWSIVLDLTRQDLALLMRLTPEVALASGVLDGRVEIAGSVNEPQLLGELAVSRGVLLARGQRTRVTGIDGRIRFEGRRAVVERVAGLVGSGGFHAQGEVGLVTLDPSRVMSNHFNLTLIGRGLGIDVGEAFSGKVDADLALATPPGDEAPAVMRGQVVLTSGEIGMPQRPEVPPLIELPPFNPRLDIAVVMQPALRLRSGTINMAVSGTGHVGGTLGSPVATAIVESRRGTVDLPGATFRVTYASMEATMSPPRVPAPEMPAVADVRAFIRLDAEARVRGYQVYLTMSGPLTDPNVEPKLDLRSVPDLDSERLWAMVTGLPVGPEAPAFGSRTRALLSSGLGVVALYPLQRATARALGLEEFGVEYSQYEPMRLRLGGYMVEKLYATYVRSLAGPARAYDFTLAYQVLPTLSIGARINERNQTFWQAQTTRRF
jgi:hypothetical protein